MLVKLPRNEFIVYSDPELLYLRKMLHLRKIEIFAFAEKCQNIAFSKSKFIYAAILDLTVEPGNAKYLSLNVTHQISAFSKALEDGAVACDGRPNAGACGGR